MNHLPAEVVRFLSVGVLSELATKRRQRMKGCELGEHADAKTPPVDQLPKAFSVPQRCESGDPAEAFGEMTLVTEPNFTADLDDALGRFDEQSLRVFDTASENVLGRRESQDGSKSRVEVRRR